MYDINLLCSLFFFKKKKKGMVSYKILHKFVWIGASNLETVTVITAYTERSPQQGVIHN